MKVVTSIVDVELKIINGEDGTLIGDGLGSNLERYFTYY
jgi:hypothetical protein